MYAEADQLPWFGKKELVCLLSFTCGYVVSVRRDFHFGWAVYFIVARPEPSI